MKSKEIKAVFFDLDGTLADTMPVITKAMNRTLSHYNFPQRTYSEMRDCINYGVSELVRLAFPEGCTTDLLKEALGLYQQNYGEIYLETDEPYDGMFEVLDHLKSEGYILGVISNKSDIFTVNMTKDIFGDDTFDFILGQGRFERKPAPDAANYAASKFGLTTDEIAFVGDSHVDIQFALNSGMVPIGVTWGYRDEPVLISEGARNIARTPLDLIKIIDGLKQVQNCK